MANTVRKVDYFYTKIPNRPGEGAKVLEALCEAGINLLAISGFPRERRTQLDLIPENTMKFRAAAKKRGLRLSPRKTGFLIQGEDKPGAVAQIFSTLATANINVTACDAVCAGKGRFGAILWVKPADVRKAAKTLGIK
jgi:hypothetical protein